MMVKILALPAGFVLDLIFGDPRWLYHPVCLIGKLISLLEKGIRRIFPKSQKGELAGGCLEVLLVCGLCFLVPFGCTVWLAAMAWFSPGNLLVLSASCHEILKDRKYEGI